MPICLCSEASTLRPGISTLKRTTSSTIQGEVQSLFDLQMGPSQGLLQRVRRTTHKRVAPEAAQQERHPSICALLLYLSTKRVCACVRVRACGCGEGRGVMHHIAIRPPSSTHHPNGSKEHTPFPPQHLHQTAELEGTRPNAYTTLQGERQHTHTYIGTPYAACGSAWQPCPSHTRTYLVTISLLCVSKVPELLAEAHPGAHVLVDGEEVACL